MAEPLPPQPPQTAWTFVETLATTCCHALPPGWGGRPRARGEAALGPGVRLAGGFPDPRGRLETALADFRRFLAAASTNVSHEAAIVAELEKIGIK